MYIDVYYIIYICILYSMYEMANSIRTFLFDQFSNYKLQRRTKHFSRYLKDARTVKTVICNVSSLSVCKPVLAESFYSV